MPRSTDPLPQPAPGIRVPSQRRGQDALDKLLDAGAEILAEQGMGGFTLAAVSKRAGVSYGALYWRVESKEALLNAIFERFREQASKRNALLDGPNWDQLTIAQATERAVREISKSFSFNPALMREFGLYAGSDPAFLAGAAINVRESSRMFSRLLTPRLQTAGHSDPHGAPAATHTAVVGAMAARLTWTEFHLGPPLEWDRFVDGLCVMAVAGIEAGLPR